MNELDHAATFHALHRADAPQLLVLPNAWDAMSARVIEEAGAPAIATTSAGVSWSLGRQDGQDLSRDEMVAAVGRIATAVRIPVSADVEGGYGGGSPDDVAETVRAVIGVGAVGINLEDTPGAEGQVLLAPDVQAKRIASARSAAASEGVQLFINARIDVFLAEAGPEEGRFEDAVSRARVYAEAGADGAFVPGVLDPATIERLAAEIELPLNILAGPGAPPVADLQRLGVRRVSLGSSLALTIMAMIQSAARVVLEDGMFGPLSGELGFPQAQELFAHRD